MTQLYKNTTSYSFNGQWGLKKKKRSYNSVLRKAKPFSEQKGGQRHATVAKFDLSLENLSSGSPKEKLLEDYLLRNKKGKLIFKNIIGNYYQGQTQQIVKNIGELYKNTNMQDRKTVLSTIAPIYSKEKLRNEFGLHVPTKSYRKAKKIAKTGVGKYIKKKQNTNNISQDTVEAIRKFCYKDSISREAANRTVISRCKTNDGEIIKTPIPVRYLQDTKRNIHLQYIKEHTNKHSVSLSTFKKYMPHELKKATRDTDKCNICEEGKKRLNYLNILKKKTNPTTEQKNKIKKLEEQVNLYLEHRETEKTIRMNFNKQRDELIYGDGLFVMDFKENMCLGRGQQEASRDFYDKPHRSVFCIAVYTREPSIGSKKGKLKIRYYDFISDCLNHDTQFVFDCFNMLYNSEYISDLHLSKNANINIWMDNAPQHFRTYEIMAQGANLQQKYPSHKIAFNYFAEYHGKCICDSHFSTISRIYREKTKSFEYKDPIYTTKDFIKLLKDGIHQSNELKARKNQITRKKHPNKYNPDLTYVRFFDYKRTKESHSSKIEQIPTPNFTCYYYFTFPTEKKSIQYDDIYIEDNIVSKIIAKFHETSDEHTREYIVKRKITTTKKKLKQGWDKSSQAPEKTFLTNLQRKKNGRNSNGKPKKKTTQKKSTNNTTSNAKKQTKKKTKKIDSSSTQAIENDVNATIKAIQERNNQLGQYGERLSTLSTNARDFMRKYNHLYTPQDHPYSTQYRPI